MRGLTTVFSACELVHEVLVDSVTGPGCTGKRYVPLTLDDVTQALEAKPVEPAAAGATVADMPAEEVSSEVATAAAGDAAPDSEAQQGAEAKTGVDVPDDAARSAAVDTAIVAPGECGALSIPTEATPSVMLWQKEVGVLLVHTRT